MLEAVREAGGRLAVLGLFILFFPICASPPTIIIEQFIEQSYECNLQKRTR